jgi:putative heme-binding domain-containing protein
VGIAYIDTALQDKDENIRITAIRAALEIHADTIAVVRGMVNDPSWAVRREAVLALRHNAAAAATGLWARFAVQYDGRDRWYLEALGIAADGQWDADFSAWMQAVHNDYNTPAGRDIVWRARTDAALPLLARIISDPANDPQRELKFFRAFDFHRGPAKQKVLLSLLAGHHPEQGRIDAIVLLLLDAKTPRTPVLDKALSSALQVVRGTQDYIDLADRYKLKDKGPELLALAEGGGDADIRSNALQLLLNTGGSSMVSNALARQDDIARALIGTLGMVEDKKNKDLLQAIVLDKKYGVGFRLLAQRSMGVDWTGEDRILMMAKNRTLPGDLRDSAAVILSHSNREEIRKEGVVYLPPVNAGVASAIAPIDKLVSLSGDTAAGRMVFMTYCMSCHQVNHQGIDFGPNLSEIGSKLSKEGLYTAILLPSAGISFGYDGYIFRLKNGNRLVGYVQSQTENDVTIKMIGGQTEKHSKVEILEKKGYGKSLMTEGLPGAMGQQKFVDLVSWLSTLKKKG